MANLPKQVKVKPNFFLLWGKYIGITLWPFGIYLRTIKVRNLKRLINHEMIHWHQQKQMLGLFFYIWYFFEWIVRIFTHGKAAYRNVSFEREAYDNDQNLDYLKTRKAFRSWWRYIKYNPYEK